MFNFLVAETVNSSYLGIKIATFRLKSCLVLVVNFLLFNVVTFAALSWLILATNLLHFNT